MIAQNACDRHRLERGADDMRGTCPVRIIRCFGFEQLGVRQDDSQLIVQAMKQGPKIADVWGFEAIFNHFQG